MQLVGHLIVSDTKERVIELVMNYRPQKTKHRHIELDNIKQTQFGPEYNKKDAGCQRQTYLAKINCEIY